MLSNEELDNLIKIADGATQEWGPFIANYPFYVVVKKPAPSLSKLDSRNETLWRYQDGLFVATFSPQLVKELLNEIKKKREV